MRTQRNNKYYMFINTNFVFRKYKTSESTQKRGGCVPMYVIVYYTYLPRCHILFVYSKLGQRRLSGIAPFQDFMAHGRLQAAITAVDIVLPLSLFISLSLCDRYENRNIPL